MFRSRQRCRMSGNRSQGSLLPIGAVGRGGTNLHDCLLQASMSLFPSSVMYACM